VTRVAQFTAIVTPAGTPVMTRADFPSGGVGSVTGTWGTGQNRTAGNTLIAVVTCGGASTASPAISTPGGWWQVGDAANGNDPNNAHCSVSVYFRTASGGEGAPGFFANLAGAAVMTVTLFEFTGAAATGSLGAQDNFVWGSPADVTGTYSSGASPLSLPSIRVSATAGRVTSVPGGYAIAVFAQQAAAGTNTWNPGSGWSNLVSDGGTSSVLHTAIDVQPGVATAVALSESGNWTTHSAAFAAAMLVSVAGQTGGYEVFANDAAATITAGGTTAPAAGTPEYWTAASWAAFPAASNIPPQTIFHVADPNAPSETIAVLNTATGLVVRGADGTIPVAHTAGFTVLNVVSSGYLQRNGEWVVPPPTGIAAVDSANVRAALSSAATSGGGRVVMQSGTYAGDAHQFYVPPSTTLQLHQDTIWKIGCSDGSAVDAISLDECASLRGDGSGSGTPGGGGQILATSSVNCRALIANNKLHFQEYCYLDGLQVNASAATYAVAVIDMENVFSNSGFRNVVAGGNTAMTGLPVFKIAGGGPIYLRSCSIGGGGGDVLYVGGCGGLWVEDCEFDGPADGYHNVNLDGSTNIIYNALFSGLHTENGIPTTVGPTAGVKANGVQCLTILNWGLYTTSTVNKVGLWVTAADNAQIYVQGVKNVNGITPVIRDDHTGAVNFGGGGNLSVYNGPGGQNLASTHIGPLMFGNGDLRFFWQEIALASTSVDAALGNFILVDTLTAPVTVAAPSNPVLQQMLFYRFVQDGSGGHAVSWDTAFRVAAGAVSTTSSTISIVGFFWDFLLSKWVQMWATTGV
jgi:hypothetical protein